MHGSFTPDSAEKFLQLMAAAGYETRESTQNEGLENFSSGLNRQVDTWATAAENFSETRGEYIDNYDYTRCVRPDGSSYGPLRR